MRRAGDDDTRLDGEWCHFCSPKAGTDVTLSGRWSRSCLKIEGESHPRSFDVGVTPLKSLDGWGVKLGPTWTDLNQGTYYGVCSCRLGLLVHRGASVQFIWAGSGLPVTGKLTV